MSVSEEIDQDVRLHIYERFVADRRPPTVAGTAQALGIRRGDVADSYRRLADERVIVLESGTLDIWMANPLSARPTPYKTFARERWWYGNCAWDAPGILAMLHEDGRVETTCPDCDDPLVMTVSNGDVEPVDAVAHFAVPAKRWWEDIGFT